MQTNSKKTVPNNFNWHNWEKHIIFIQNQIQKKYQREGLLAIYHLGFSFVCLIIGFLLALLVRLLKPWIIIRIRKMYSEKIGHFASNTEVYLCEKDRGINIPDRRFLDIWYYDGYVSNAQLQKMWNRCLDTWPQFYLHFFPTINSILPAGEIHTIPWRINQARDIHNVLEVVPPHLSFKQDEEEYGKKKLATLGIQQDSLFVCLLGRDSKYIQLTEPDFDPHYHSYRDVDIMSFLPAAEEMARQGYYVIRMGSEVIRPFTSDNPMIIDYAMNGQRSDFMDIYLGAKCHFFISVGTGLDAIPEIFRRPLLYVNQAPLEFVPSWGKIFLFIPKKYWLNKEERFMSFREIIESGAGRFLSNNQYIDKGITLVENTPGEIREVTVEMEERLKGTWVITEEDEDLQRRFWSLFKPGELHGKIYSRIGAAFIRKYKALLD
jgi:putative glycosyltransferase (TIGR04372 family)